MTGCGSRATTPTFSLRSRCRGAGGGDHGTVRDKSAVSLALLGARCGRVRPAPAPAGTPVDPRPEREPAADDTVADTAGVRALPGAAAHAPAVRAQATQVGRAAAA